MNTAQTGIISDAKSSAVFLCVNVKDSSINHAFFNHVLSETHALSAKYQSAELVSTIAVGAEAWDKMFLRKPPELRSFPALQGIESATPNTPYDVFIHIRSERPDISFEAAKNCILPFSSSINVVEDINGFKYLDNRDLTGFVDGTENPNGDNRAAVALVSDNTLFNQGSYIHIQRYEHDLSAWNGLVVKKQEDIIARTKENNIEYASDEKSMNAHIKRVNLKNSAGESMEILRHSMPYGNTQNHGLFFVSYAKTPTHFENMLNSMVMGDEHGNVDYLMRYTKAVTGAAFFAPPKEFLNDETHYR